MSTAKQCEANPRSSDKWYALQSYRCKSIRFKVKELKYSGDSRTTLIYNSPWRAVVKKAGPCSSAQQVHTDATEYLHFQSLQVCM